jgi:Protein of unknown function (DUF1552)
MFVRKIAFNRRTFLRASGAVLALPMLDAMSPAFAATIERVPRFSFIYIPNGVNPATWFPTGSGKQFEFSPALAALEPFRDKVVVLGNMSHHAADRQNDGAGDHSRATGVFLSGCHAKRTQGADLHLGITADQIVAKTLGKDCLLPSLEISLEDRNVAPLCDEGYTCVYSNTLSWSSATTPLPMENDPRLVFERLFGEEANPKERAIRLREDRSILDSLTGSIARLNGKLGAGDKRKVDEYLNSIREVEVRLQRIEAQNAKSPTAAMAMERPMGVPEKFEDHIRLMFDLQTLAFQGDITRVTTLMVGREMAVRSYPEIGVPDSHHSLSHHDNNPAKLAKLTKIDAYHVQQMAYLLGKLRDVKDGENTLLDNAFVVYGGGIGNGNLHNHERLPLVVAGGGAGKLEGGRYLSFKNDTRTSNMLRTILNKAGVETETLGDSTGLLPEL